MVTTNIELLKKAIRESRRAYKTFQEAESHSREQLSTCREIIDGFLTDRGVDASRRSSTTPTSCTAP